MKYIILESKQSCKPELNNNINKCKFRGQNTVRDQKYILNFKQN